MIRDLNNIPAFINNVDSILQATAEAVGQYLEGKILDMIDEQGRGQWEPLADSTIAQKGSSKSWENKGGLRAQIAHRILTDGLGGTSIQVGIFESEYGYIAHLLEFGTDAYVIRPKEKKALNWRGLPHPVKEVHHPGIPERPLFRLTFDLEAENIEKLMAEELNRQIDKYLL